MIGGKFGLTRLGRHHLPDLSQLLSYGVRPLTGGFDAEEILPGGNAFGIVLQVVDVDDTDVQPAFLRSASFECEYT